MRSGLSGAAVQRDPRLSHLEQERLGLRHHRGGGLDGIAHALLSFAGMRD